MSRRYLCERLQVASLMLLKRLPMLTSLPGWRDARRGETNLWFRPLKSLPRKSMKYIIVDVSLLYSHFSSRKPVCNENYRGASHAVDRFIGAIDRRFQRVCAHPGILFSASITLWISTTRVRMRTQCSVVIVGVPGLRKGATGCVRT